MLQLWLQGFPENASQINALVSIQNKEGLVTYWVGQTDFFSHKVGDKASLRFAITSLIVNNLARAYEISCPPLNIPQFKQSHNRRTHVLALVPGKFFRLHDATL